MYVKQFVIYYPKVFSLGEFQMHTHKRPKKHILKNKKNYAKFPTLISLNIFIPKILSKNKPRTTHDMS